MGEPLKNLKYTNYKNSQVLGNWCSVVDGLYAGEFGDGSPVRNIAAIQETDDEAGTKCEG